MKLTRIEVLREAVKVVVAALSNTKVLVSQIGIEAYVTWDKSGKPTRVNIPNLPDNASEELIVAVQGFIDHEVAHILFTSFDAIKKAHEAGCAAAHNIIEDTYIERNMKDLYRGSAKNLDNVWKYTTNELIKEPLDAAVASMEKHDLLGAGLPVAIHAAAGNPAAKEFLDDPKYKPVVDLVEEAVGSDILSRIPHCKDSMDTLRVAVDMQNRLNEWMDSLIEKEKEGDGEGEEGECSPEGSGGKSGKSGKSSEGKTGNKGGKDSGGEGAHGEFGGSTDESEEEEEESHSGPPSEEELEEEEGEEESGGESEEEEKSEAEKEVEAIRKALEEMKDKESALAEKIGKDTIAAIEASSYWPLTKSYDRVERYEPSLAKGQIDYVSKQIDAVVSHAGIVQKQLERAISAQSFARYVPGFRSGRLHGPSLYKLPAGDDRVFRRKQKITTKDVDVQVVIDCSGSMSGRKMILACEAAFVLAQALDRMNINNQIVGFTTTYSASIAQKDVERTRDKGLQASRYQPIYMPIFKDWNQRLTANRKQAIMYAPHGLNMRNNIDGESLEYAAHSLSMQPGARKVMIVLSDGYPAGDGGHGPVRYHLKVVVERLLAEGIDLFGIGIMDDAVRSYYPNYKVIYKLEELSSVAVKALQDMLIGKIAKKRKVA